MTSDVGKHDFKPNVAYPSPRTSFSPSRGAEGGREPAGAVRKKKIEAVFHFVTPTDVAGLPVLVIPLRDEKPNPDGKLDSPAPPPLRGGHSLTKRRTMQLGSRALVFLCIAFDSVV